MRKSVILLFFLSLSSALVSQDDISSLDSIQEVVFKEEALVIQRQFLEGIRNIITCSNSEDLINAKSYFLSLFFNSNAKVDDIIESNNAIPYPVFRYRDVLTKLENNSPIFNKEFKNDTIVNLTKGSFRTFEDGSNVNYYPFKIELHFLEQLSQSKFLDETRTTNPSYNAYIEGILKKMKFDIYINGDEEREIRISSVDIIASKNGASKDKLESIEQNENPWSSESEAEYVGSLENQVEDISIENIETLEDSIPIFLKAYPTGGYWSGAGVDRNSGKFSPMLAYDPKKLGRQEVILKYNKKYDSNIRSSEVKVILSESLALFSPPIVDDERLFFDPNLIPLSELSEMGISSKSLKNISKSRRNCNRFKTVKDFFTLLDKNDELTLNGKTYSYSDLKNSLYKILKFERPNFYYLFDPNYLEESQLEDMKIDPYTREQFLKYLSAEKRVFSVKSLKKIGCFCNYDTYLDRWVKFNPENRTSAKLTMSSYIVPGLGHMRYETQSSSNTRSIRTIVYGSSFIGATSYAIYQKTQSSKWNSRHIAADNFRDANFNLAEANSHHKKFIIGSAISAGIFLANITHLKLLEIRNRKATDSDSVPRTGVNTNIETGYFQFQLNNNGLGLVYNF